MEIIVIDKVEAQPENVVGFPQYLLYRLLEQGPGSLEAEALFPSAENTIWRFKPCRLLVQPFVVIFNPRGFRSTLARFGFLCGISSRGGHTLFQIRFADEEDARPERFAIYLCNEPTMGFWIRVYLYAIDNVYPNYGGMFDEKPNVTSTSP